MHLMLNTPWCECT